LGFQAVGGNHFTGGAAMRFFGFVLPSRPARPDAGIRPRPGWPLLCLLALTAPAGFVGAQDRPGKIPKPPPTVQFKEPQLGAALVEASRFIRVTDARDAFEVNGKGLTVAVLDTGLRTSHVDFAGRVVAQQNFTSDGPATDASDKDGHGTNVGGSSSPTRIMSASPPPTSSPQSAGPERRQFRRH
jgi:hypothetical protein